MYRQDRWAWVKSLLVWQASAGEESERCAPLTPRHLQPPIMLGQGRWGPRVNNLVRNCATAVLLAGHGVLRRSCLNFSTSKLLRCPPICQLSQDSLPIRCYKKTLSMVWCYGCSVHAAGFAHSHSETKRFVFHAENVTPSVSPPCQLVMILVIIIIIQNNQYNWCCTWSIYIEYIYWNIYKSTPNSDSNHHHHHHPSSWSHFSYQTSPGTSEGSGPQWSWYR